MMTVYFVEPVFYCVCLQSKSSNRKKMIEDDIALRPNKCQISFKIHCGGEAKQFLYHLSRELAVFSIEKKEI